MLKAVRTMLLSTCLASPLLSLAQDRSSTAEELLRKSGTWEQLGGVEAQVRARLQWLSTATPRPSPDELNVITKATESSFAPARLRATATRAIADGLGEQDVVELRRWYESPTGVAIAKLEEQASAHYDDPREIAAQGTAVLQRSTAERRELLDSLVRETKAAEATVEIAIDTTIALQRGIAAVTPRATPLQTSAEIKAALEPHRSELLDAFRKLMTASFALTYETLPDADLVAYLTFLKSPAAQHFNTLTSRAMDAAMSEAAEEFAVNIQPAKDASTPTSAARPQSTAFAAESRRDGETCNTNSDCAGTLRCETGTCRGVAGAPQSIPNALGAEESFQKDADVVRLTHLKYYSDLLAEYHRKTGIYPLQDKAADAPVYVFVGHDWQLAVGTPPYKHSVVSMRDWINELETGLGRPVDEYYDPQYFSEGYKPTLYVYMVYRDTFFFAVHLYQDYPFTKKVAEHHNKLEISNKPSAQNRVEDPERLFASEDFRTALKVPYKADFFQEREAKYLHFTKQQK